MDDLLIYALIQAIQIAKAKYFAELRQQGVAEEEIRERWREKWSPYHIIDPEEYLDKVTE